MLAIGGNDEIPHEPTRADAVHNRVPELEGRPLASVVVAMEGHRLLDGREVRREGEPPESPTRLVIGVAADGVAQDENLGAETLIATPTMKADVHATATETPVPIPATSIEALIIQYDWPDDTALAIAWCESSHNPNAVNSESGAAGLFQFLHYWHGWKLQPGESWFDPAVNVRIAYETWLADGGFSAWNASRHCWGN